LRLLRPLPRGLTRALSLLAIAAWVLQMGVLLRHASSSAPVALAADLAHYGSSAKWNGIYYRGDKIGFSVSQTTPVDDGYEIREDGRLQMVLLGSPVAVRTSSVAVVDRAFALRRFEWSLDPGTGPTVVSGELDGLRLHLRIRSSAGEREETRELPAPPALELNLARRLAARGLEQGQVHEIEYFNPITLSNSPMRVEVQSREVVRAAGRPVPAFRVEIQFAGIVTRSWITDVGEVVKQESPTGHLVVRETPEQAQALAVPGRVKNDLLAAAALVPTPPTRIDDPTAVERLRVRLEGGETFESSDLQGAGQSASGDVIEVRDPRDLEPGPSDPDLERYLRPESLIESDAEPIRAEAARAIATAPADPRGRAERLVRHVHAILEKKPTVSLPSALEVLKTRVGDCNEHTALYVAMARSLGIPARIAVGLVYMSGAMGGAFYYHAWAEVWIAEEDGRGLWLPVDPTLNQFPADATHVRLVRGGLDRQAAILRLFGQAKLSVLDVQLRPGSTPILVGQQAAALPSIDLPASGPQGSGPSCWSSPGR
jgi:transglutaminase-like putative cysteine protease